MASLLHSWPWFDTSYIVFEVANVQIMCSWCMNCGILSEYDRVCRHKIFDTYIKTMVDLRTKRSWKEYVMAGHWSNN
jgi:pyruvoyl-dependent arginine decarboxylase (PvlArgDC)